MRPLPVTVRIAAARSTDTLSRRLRIGLLLLATIGATVVNWPRPGLPADASRLEVELDGLDCGFWCPIGVDAVLKELPGLEVRSVDVASGRVVVAFDPHRVDPSAIVQRLGAHWRVRRPPAISRPGPSHHKLGK